VCTRHGKAEKPSYRYVYELDAEGRITSSSEATAK